MLSALGVVHMLWKQDHQAKNAQRIAEQGQKLYDKFVGFVENMVGIDRYLGKAQESYTEAFKKLKEGRGNLISQAEKLKTLGVAPAKQLDERIAQDAVASHKDDHDTPHELPTSSTDSSSSTTERLL